MHLAAARKGQSRGVAHLGARRLLSKIALRLHGHGAAMIEFALPTPKGERTLVRKED